MKTWLTDVIPANARKYVYALLMIVAIVYAAFQASDGDIATTIGTVVAALIAAMAVSNTAVKE